MSGHTCFAQPVNRFELQEIVMSGGSLYFLEDVKYVSFPHFRPTGGEIRIYGELSIPGNQKGDLNLK